MRLSTHQILKFVNHHPAEIQDIFLGVREAVFKVVPTAWEKFKMNGVAYFLEENSSPLKGMICHVVPLADCVQIGFIFGAFMPDPHGLLEGTQKAKRMLHLRDFDLVYWEALEDLIKAASEIDPTTF
jgi:hypothetical protein